MRWLVLTVVGFVFDSHAPVAVGISVGLSRFVLDHDLTVSGHQVVSLLSELRLAYSALERCSAS